jgi:hypothetical protein
MHRVYIHCSRYKDYWWVQYLEPDVRTSAHGGKIDRYSSWETVEVLLSKVSIEPGERARLNDARWGIRACFIDLSEEQYTKLKCADAITERAINKRSPSHST